MLMPLNLGAYVPIPLVRLEIDYNDRIITQKLLQNDFTFSPDGKEVKLRKSTVEQICRRKAGLNNHVSINISYINREGRLEKFPDQLEIDSDNKTSETKTQVEPPQQPVAKPFKSSGI